MKHFELLLLPLLIFAMPSLVFAQTTYTTTGNTTSISTQVWSPVGTPGISDNIIIAHSCTLDVNIAVALLTINSGKTLTIPANRSLSGNITINGTLSNGASNTVLTTDGNITCDGSSAHLRLGSGTASINNIGVGKTFTLKNGATFTTTMGTPLNALSGMSWSVDNSAALTTIVYNTSSNTTLPTSLPDNQEYGNLKFSTATSTSSSKTISLTADIQILGDLTFTALNTTTTWSYTYNCAGFKIITIGAAKSVSVTQVAAHALNITGTGGDLFSGFSSYNFSPPSNGNCTVNYASPSGTQNVAGGIYQNLTVSGGGTKSLSANATVNGTLTLTNGTLTTGSNKIIVTNNQPGAVVIASTSGNITGQIERTIEAGNTGIYKFTNTNTYIVPAASQPSTTISITSYPSTYPPFAPVGTAINRYYVIAPTPSDFSAAEVRLEYLDSENTNSISELSLVEFRRDASLGAWINMGGIPDGANNFVTLGGSINTWSDWAIGNGNNPLPIQLSSFTGTFVNNAVRLNWSTASEVSNYGFHVQRRVVGSTEWNEISGSFIAGHGTTNTPQHYSFTDNAVVSGSLQYRLKQVDLDGSIHFTEPIQVEVLTGVKEVAPIEFALMQNYPNPFNPSTEIQFSVEGTSRAVLRLYNMLGQQVGLLFDDVAEAGTYYRVKVDGSSLASGMYMYQLESGSKHQLRKMILIK